ncbi:hypothetical protein E7Z54_08605 [Nocardioides sp.]|nr:hypothetical protein E7Z54_08605 [Nocardioides sp.]
MVTSSAGVAAVAGARSDAAVRVEVLSNRADLVSGGDALVEVVLPTKTDPAKVRVDLDGRDVTSAFGVRSGGRFLGVVEGLRDGGNTLTARAPGGGARIVITNRPAGGPVFAGPQVQPWNCDTETYGLQPSADAQCTTPAKFELFYKSSVSGQFSAYDPANPPPDMSYTTTDQGQRVPYVVRRERGVMDRGIYDIAVLYDPSRPWQPWAPQRGFNGKLLVPFGGDCQPRHSQGEPTDGVVGGVLNDMALSRGFAVAMSNLNVLGQNCNDVVSAEALMMLKEHFVETYGEIRYTIGMGCSGGSMQQNWIAANYPGLLDGIQPCATYPDIWETVQEAEDCYLLDRYFDQTSPHLWLAVQQQAFVAGYQSVTTCRSLWDLPVTSAYARLWFDPDNFAGCLGGGPTGGLVSTRPDWVYHPTENLEGERCTLQDYAVSVWGRRAPESWGPNEKAIGRGFANRPYDNVGVQYGLTALESGLITPEQFVDLNEKVGGLDIDWNWQPQRIEADPAALVTAYRAGKVTYPRETAKVPIIDLPFPANVEIHTPVHSEVLRERLVQANGHARNHVIWQGMTVPGEESLALMDRWLSAIERDERDIPLEEKVVANRPADAVDACWIGERKITDTSVCRTAFPYYGTPRIAAGGPLTDNVLKCQLEPLSRDDYTVDFTNAQWNRLESIFADGVCDYRKPPVGHQPSLPWMSFTDGPGGRPLGPPPTSSPIR